MKLGIMQPYFLPYIGYFQLIKAVDKFVLYDDVNYIKNGWINRNRILIKKDAHYITVHQKDASSNKLINEVEIIDNRAKLGKTIVNAYSKAPYFKKAWPLVEDILKLKTDKISKLAEYSIVQICNYLDIKTTIETSSSDYGSTANLKSDRRIIAICNINGAIDYINPIGGIKLYDKRIFLRNGINLYFLKSGSITYRQFNNPFIDNLSILDVIMFNSSKSIRTMLDSYSLL